MKLHTLIAVLLVLILMKNCAATEGRAHAPIYTLADTPHGHPGVSLNFGELLGTGGGASEQDSTNINFPEVAPCRTHPWPC